VGWSGIGWGSQGERCRRYVEMAGGGNIFGHQREEWRNSGEMCLKWKSLGIIWEIKARVGGVRGDTDRRNTGREIRKAYKLVLGKSPGKRQLGRHRRGW
jgi:hypothetical protein